MFGMALQAKDTVGATAVSIAVVVAFAACRRFVPGRSPTRLKHFALWLVAALSAFTLAMVNWRMYGWIAAMSELSVDAARRRIPLWTLNLFTCVLCAVMLLTVYMSFPKRRQESVADAPGRN
jgi:hypothetical protein